MTRADAVWTRLRRWLARQERKRLEETARQQEEDVVWTRHLIRDANQRGRQ